MSFTKLHSQVVASSVWQQPYATRIVWVTMLATCDTDGAVLASIPGLAALAGVTIDETEEALECFQSPDKYSTTTTHNGKRIQPCDGGWTILNYEKYQSDGGSAKNKKTEYKPTFDDFWAVVHHRVGKAAARKSYARAVARKSVEEKISKSKAATAIVKAMVEFSKSPDADPTDRTPIHPTTWLNQGRYDDDPECWSSSCRSDPRGNLALIQRREQQRSDYQQQLELSVVPRINGNGHW